MGEARQRTPDILKKNHSLVEELKIEGVGFFTALFVQLVFN
jgi:hypothetical protein